MEPETKIMSVAEENEKLKQPKKSKLSMPEDMLSNEPKCQKLAHTSKIFRQNTRGELPSQKGKKSLCATYMINVLVSWPLITKIGQYSKSKHSKLIINLVQTWAV